MENANCPICGQNDTEIIFKKGNLDKDLINVICKKCGLVFINPRLSEQEYNAFHREDFLSEKSVTEMEDLKKKTAGRDLEIKRAIFNFIKEYIAPDKNVLDVGCGFGGLMNIVKNESGANVYGIELSDLDARAAKEFYGFDVFRGPLEEFSSYDSNRGKFDVVILHHTFEHLANPVFALEQIKKLLKPEGILYIGVPNVMNIKKRPEIFFQVAHPFSYSPHSLKLILEKAGFRVVKFNRDAGFPGGMDVAAKTNTAADNIVGLDEGASAAVVAEYVKNTAEKFAKLRISRDKLLFFLPKGARVALGRLFYNFSKNKFNNRKFFFFAVLPSSVIAGGLFVLHHLISWFRAASEGKIYSFFSFINPDPLAFYAPFARAAYDGAVFSADGRIFENFYLPNLWTTLAPALILPFFWLTRSISFAFLSGHFAMAAAAFICFFYICRRITGNRIFSLLYSFVFISATLAFNYLFPTSFDNLKLVARTILPVGSPPGEVMLGKYVSFSLLPGFAFFVSALLLVYLAIIGRKKIYVVLAGLNIALLAYIVFTHFAYLYAVLGAAFLIFIFYKDYDSAKKIIWIYIVSAAASAFYWLNFLQIRMLPWSDEFYKRLGGELTHQFRWSRLLDYAAYFAVALLILHWGKKRGKIKESVLAAAGVLAAIVILNMQVFAGFNPEPTVWAFHQLFLGFALGWLVLIYWFYEFLRKKTGRLAAGAAFLILFLMIMGKMIYAEYYMAGIFYKYQHIPRELYESFEWLNKNTEKDSVVVTPSLATNALLPAFTHNNSMLPAALTSPLPLTDIKDRYFTVFKFFNVSPEAVRNALTADLVPSGDPALDMEHGLFGFLVFDYYCNHALDAYTTERYCPTAASVKAASDLADEYENYPAGNRLMKQYRADYVYYGPYEKKIAKPDLKNFDKIYDKDGVEIYKIGLDF